MTRRRIDANQTEIVAALRKAGCTVAITSALGDGFPDLVVGRRGRNFLMELKDGSKPPSRQRLTPEEKRFRLEWDGSVSYVRSPEEALQAVGCPHLCYGNQCPCRRYELFE